jgi:hypothetical protein
VLLMGRCKQTRMHKRARTQTRTDTHTQRCTHTYSHWQATARLLLTFSRMELKVFVALLESVPELQHNLLAGLFAAKSVMDDGESVWGA